MCEFTEFLLKIVLLTFCDVESSSHFESQERHYVADMRALVSEIGYNIYLWLYQTASKSQSESERYQYVQLSCGKKRHCGMVMLRQ